MFCGAVLSTVCYFAAARLVSRKQAGRGPEIPRFAILPMLLCGVITCSYQWINFHLSGRLPASVLFPIFNGSLILIVTAVSVPFFHGLAIFTKQLCGVSCTVMWLASSIMPPSDWNWEPPWHAHSRAVAKRMVVFLILLLD